MKGTTRKAFFTLRVATVCLAVFCCVSARSDSWLPPSPFNTGSENGKYVARVIPAEKVSKPLLIVSAVGNGKTNEVWRSELGNHVSPCQVWISDDGSSVVTSDNWAGVGYGDDVVAIYSRKGRLTKYSLEQIAPQPAAKSNAFSLFAEPYRDKFPHSTSSRHWRENSIEFFREESGQLLFCLWLDWENRWVVWRMSDGQMINVTRDQTERLNSEGRMRSLKQAKVESFASAQLNFLGRLRFKEDRPLIEVWLHDPEFSSGSMQSSSSDKLEMEFYFTARSNKRETADRILSRWDGKEVSAAGLGSQDTYQFLGSLSCVVAFPTAPAKNEGVIRLYLIPDSRPLRDWARVIPEHYLIADLKGSFPYLFVDGQVKDGKLPREVNFIIYGITPGKYRLKAVWNRTAPIAKEDAVVYHPHSGDYESESSPDITIRKGEVAKDVKIECMKLTTE